MISKRCNEGCSFETAKRQSGSGGKTKAIGVEIQVATNLWEEKLWADEVLVRFLANMGNDDHLFCSFVLRISRQ